MHHSWRCCILYSLNSDCDYYYYHEANLVNCDSSNITHSFFLVLNSTSSFANHLSLSPSFSHIHSCTLLATALMLSFKFDVFADDAFISLNFIILNTIQRRRKVSWENVIIFLSRETKIEEKFSCMMRDLNFLVPFSPLIFIIYNHFC